MAKKIPSPSKLAPQPFEVRPSAIQGLGAFATRRIRKGACIIEYIGERITDEEADKRYDDMAMDRHHTFLFSLGDGTSIDASFGGNDARFINHACAPNCEAILDGGHIFIEAIRDIEMGEELFYDYAYERQDEGGDDEELSKHYKCLCGAPTCRGTILAPRQEKKSKKSKNPKQTKKPAEPRTKRSQSPGSESRPSKN